MSAATVKTCGDVVGGWCCQSCHEDADSEQGELLEIDHGGTRYRVCCGRVGAVQHEETT